MAPAALALFNQSTLLHPHFDLLVLISPVPVPRQNKLEQGAPTAGASWLALLSRLRLEDARPHLSRSRIGAHLT